VQGRRARSEAQKADWRPNFGCPDDPPPTLPATSADTLFDHVLSDLQSLDEIMTSTCYGKVYTLKPGRRR